MPIVSLAASNPFVDGRQSNRALAVRAGIERYFEQQGHATLPELTLPGGRRADIVALCPKGRVTIVEIKSSLADLRADQKWRDYTDWCDELLFATLPDVPREEFPRETGLMLADTYGAEIIRSPSAHKLGPAKRKTVHLAFARASAMRLARCCAHAGVDSSGFS
ncbi:MAG: MmcB family DNA repair protein [Pseudomonadota bacterium]